MVVIGVWSYYHYASKSKFSGLTLLSDRRPQRPILLVLIGVITRWHTYAVIRLLTTF